MLPEIACSSCPVNLERYVAMRIFHFILVVFLAAGCHHDDAVDDFVQDNEPHVYPLRIDDVNSEVWAGYGRTETTELNTWLTQGDFKDQPKWQLGTPAPPVSAKDAMVAASKCVKSLVENGDFPDESSIHGVRLCSFDPTTGDWYYVVEFSYLMAGGFIPQLSVAVLMDGTVPPPTVSDRIDIGWPLPDKISPVKPDGLTDEAIVNEFIDSLNPDRLYAGQMVKVTGELTKIESGHPYSKCGQRWAIALENKNLLLYNPHNPYIKSGVTVTLTGELIGYRSLSDRNEDWQNLTLCPGIREKDSVARSD